MIGCLVDDGVLVLVDGGYVMVQKDLAPYG
jgi:hypothetical protein